MPNFSFVSNAKFRPFSYAEMLQPLQAYTNEYNTIQEGIGELGAKAGVFDKMANEQTDPRAYQMYKQYSEDLAKQAESLAKYGLTPSTRQGLIDMKRRYSSEIMPIEQAYARRQSLIDEQRKAMQQDSTILFDRPASTLSLDELIANPALSPQSYSGSLLTKQVGTAAQNLAKEARENPRKWRTILGNQYYETIMQRGFRPEEVIQAISNNPNASPILRSMVEDAISSSGITGWNDEEALNRAYDYARQGLWQAVGDTQYQQVSNKAYDYAMQLEMAKAKKGLAGEESGLSPLTYRSVGKTSVDRTKKTEELQSELDFIRQLKANPSIINEKATRRVGKPTTSGTNGGFVYTEWKDEEYQPNAEKLNKIVSKYGIKNGTMDQIEQFLDKEIRSSAIRNFIYKPNITQSDLIAKVIKENAMTIGGATGNTGLYEFDDGKKGDPIDLSDMPKYFSEDTNLSYDPEIGLILNSTKENKVKQAVIDPELIDDADRTLKNMMDSVNVLLDNGHDVEASNKIKDIMNYIYGKFNTLAKRESNTDSK